MTEEIGLFDAIYSCRAMRRLDSRPVPEELLIKLIDAANQAASGSNMQRARWIVIRDAEQRKQLAALNKKSGRYESGSPTLSSLNSISLSMLNSSARASDSASRGWFRSKSPDLGGRSPKHDRT